MFFVATSLLTLLALAIARLGGGNSFPWLAAATPRLPSGGVRRRSGHGGGDAVDHDPLARCRRGWGAHDARGGDHDDRHRRDSARSHPARVHRRPAPGARERARRGRARDRGRRRVPFDPEAGIRRRHGPRGPRSVRCDARLGARCAGGTCSSSARSRCVSRACPALDEYVIAQVSDIRTRGSTWANAGSTRSRSRTSRSARPHRRHRRSRRRRRELRAARRAQTGRPSHARRSQSHPRQPLTLLRGSR